MPTSDQNRLKASEDLVAVLSMRKLVSLIEAMPIITTTSATPSFPSNELLSR